MLRSFLLIAQPPLLKEEGTPLLEEEGTQVYLFRHRYVINH